MLSEKDKTLIGILFTTLIFSLWILCVIGAFYFGIANNGMGFWFSIIGVISISMFMLVVWIADREGYID